MAKTKKKKKIVTTPNDGGDVKKLDHSCISGEKIKCYSHSGKPFGGFPKGYILNHSIDITFLKWENYRNGYQITVAWG